MSDPPTLPSSAAGQRMGRGQRSCSAMFSGVSYMHCFPKKRLTVWCEYSYSLSEKSKAPRACIGEITRKVPRSLADIGCPWGGESRAGIEQEVPRFCLYFLTALFKL